LSKKLIDIGNNKSISIRSDLKYYDDHYENFLYLYNLLNKTNKRNNNYYNNNSNSNSKSNYILIPQRDVSNFLLKTNNQNKFKNKNNKNYFRNYSSNLNDNLSNISKKQNNIEYEKFKDFSNKNSIRYSKFYHKLNSNIDNLKPINSKDLLIKNFNRLFNNNDNNNNNKILIRNNNNLIRSKSISFFNLPSSNSREKKYNNYDFLYNQSFNSRFSTKIN
jgi:hypothetical protein